MAQGQSATSLHDYITSAINPKYHGKGVIINVITVTVALVFQSTIISKY